ncbi:MAG: Folylpolyglutamate synthase, partial [Candidatus Roizmanbacteria bacterium GW2011_GWA2_37_7]
MKFDILKEAEKYLLRYIPPSDDSLTAKQKFARACALMDLLDNPQNKMSVIHVAGTSGKGSTAQIIAQILTGHGFKTGLTVSPHILDFRERTQINCMNVSENTYIHYLEEIVPSILEISNSQYGKPTFFEIAMAHAYFSFCREKVDYAIVETGMGGRFDASNTATASDKLCVLTKIGFDHQEFLGKTIFKIATEKAEIIHKSNLTLSTVQSKEAE